MINKTQSMFLVIFIAISLLFIAEIYEPAFKVWGVAFEKVMTKASTNTTEETNADQNYYRKKYSRVSSTEQYTTQNNHKVIDTDIGEILEYIFWLTYKNRLIQKISYIDIFISKNSFLQILAGVDVNGQQNVKSAISVRCAYIVIPVLFPRINANIAMFVKQEPNSV